MIIPYGHERTVSRVPYLTFAIIAACTLMQVYTTWFAPDLDAFGDPQAILFARFGYQSGSGLHPNLIASAFVHDGWLHLVGNMLFLWLAGSALEDRLGRIEYAILYVVGAAVAALCWSASHTGPPTVAVGASGAVSVLMGAFLVYFSETRILLWYWFLARSGTVRIAAYFVLPLWLGEQVVYAYLQRAEPGISNVGYAAHIGGFVFGLGLALLAKRVLRIGSDEA